MTNEPGKGTMSVDDDRMLRRFEQLVSIETPSGDAEGLDAAHALLTPWGTEALGRAPRRVVTDGVPHLVWETAGESAALVLCHVDTVFPRGTIAQRPFRIAEGRATGPGVFDMKAGIIVALEALASAADPERIALVITGDEETGSLTSRSTVEAAARNARAVLVPEPSLDGDVKVGRKGGAFYHLTFHGLAAHAGLEPEAGRNALLAMASWAGNLPRLAAPLLGTTVTPTRAHAGTAANVVPDAATLTVDVRASSLAELSRVDETIHSWVQESADDAQGVPVTLSGGINRPPLEPGGSATLFDLCRATARGLGLAEPGAAMVGGGSDGNFTAALGIPTLDGLGPIGHGAHAEHEWVDVASLRERARLIHGMLDALTASA